MEVQFKETSKILADFVLKYNLKVEAMRLCKVAMSNCLEDDPSGLGDFGINEIMLDFSKHTLIFEHYLYKSPFVKTEIGLYKTEINEVYMKNHEPIGYYQLDTNLNGEHFDDWLIIDEEKNNQMNIVSHLQLASEELPQKYLRRNSRYYEYISYIAQITMLYQTRHLSACQYSMIRAAEFLNKNEIDISGRNLPKGWQ